MVPQGRILWPRPWHRRSTPCLGFGLGLGLESCIDNFLSRVGILMDTLSTFCRVYMVQCVKLMLSKFMGVGFLLIDCFVSQKPVETFLLGMGIRQMTWNTQP